MSMEYDFLIPLYRVRWNTRAVLEGITRHYQPRTIHLVAPETQVAQLSLLAQDWSISRLQLHPEEEFFNSSDLTKKSICAELDLGKSLYTPGWFYQQLLKLGAFTAIDSLSEWYVVWDSDLLAVNCWRLIEQKAADISHTFALLQHRHWGNEKIVAQWDNWITKVLNVEALNDPEGTFVPHHMWFKQEHLKSFAHQINQYYQSDEHWLKLMMRSANDFGTFSEYWAYVSWVAANAPHDLSFYPYQSFGSTTERFFDDGTGLFSAALKQHQSVKSSEIELSETNFYPTYADIYSFIESAYGKDSLPSSLSFESSPRHLHKDQANLHIEELRSRWNPRDTDMELNKN
ncbi:MAG: DUF6492 family protein [Cyanobacteria bacterium J06631_6]